MNLEEKKAITIESSAEKVREGENGEQTHKSVMSQALPRRKGCSEDHKL